MKTKSNAPYEQYFAAHGLDDYEIVFRGNEEKSIELRILRRQLAGWMQTAARNTAPLDLLDIGCGTGDFLHQMGREVFSTAPKKLTLQCDILDVNPTGFAAARLGCRSVAGADLQIRREISQLWQETRVADLATGYDVILSNHVFYSCPLSHATTERLLSLLKPNGVLIVAMASAHSEVTQLRAEAGLVLQTAEHFEQTLKRHWVNYTRIAYRNRMKFDVAAPIYSKWLFGGSQISPARQNELITKYLRSSELVSYIENAALIHVIHYAECSE